MLVAHVLRLSRWGVLSGRQRYRDVARGGQTCPPDTAGDMATGAEPSRLSHVNFAEPGSADRAADRLRRTERLVAGVRGCLTLNRLGRMLAAVLLVMAVAVPGVAAADESDDAPLSELPSEYEPALDAAADQLGVAPEELKSASREELTALLCDKLDETSPDELAAEVSEALDEAPEELSEEQRAELERRLPALISQLETEYCASDEGDDADEIPVPSRIDTGGGGAATGAAMPLAFGALFAALFGLFGVGAVGRRRET